MTKEVIFSYCGGMFSYYFGIASVLQEKYDLSDVVFSATSGGSFAPLLLNSKRDIKQVFSDIIDFIDGNQDSWEDIIYNFLKQELTEEDVKNNNGKLIVKFTKLNDYLLPEKVLVKKWDNKEDLAKCISAACFVPLISGNKLYTKYRESNIIDGFFSNTSVSPVTDNENIVFRVDKWRFMSYASMIPTNDIPWLKSMFELGILDANKHKDEIDSVLTPLKENDSKNGDKIQQEQ